MLDASDALSRLDAEKQDSLKRAQQLDKEQKKPWRQEIKILAEILEKECNIKGETDQICLISTKITNIYRDLNLSIWSNVPHLIAAKYKDQSKNNSTKPLYEYSEQEIEHAREVSKNIANIPRKLLNDWFTVGRRLTQGCKKRADTEKVALEDDENGNNSTNKQRKDKVKTDEPVPHATLLSDAIGETAQVMLDVQKEVVNFPPEILARAEILAEGFKTFNSLFAPGLDRKYSKSWLGWFKTERNRDIYGKHAAAVMSFSVSNLCAECSDEQTKEWVRMEPIFSKQYETYDCLQCGYQIDTVCPKCNLVMKHQDKPVVSWQCSNCDGTIPLNRDLTREQVGDKSSIVMDDAIRVIEHLPILVSFCDWFIEWREPRIAGRKIRLRPDLSEEA